MCGIAGYIGASKKPKITFELITNIFDYLELRGTDAAGIWGTEIGPKGRIVYHKEPIRSSEFIKKQFWNQRVRKMKFNLLLTHARATSRGGGHASTNTNNHPFVSDDHHIGMVHNGTLDEAHFLRKKYQILSETDSETLLRMFEHGSEGDPLGHGSRSYSDPDGGLKLPAHVPDDIAHRIKGIRDIWSVISSGAMAVAIGERIDDHTRALYLFHNAQRPLWMADMRENLGQLFFFSSPDIWYRALAACSENVKKLCSGHQKLHDVPLNEAWVFMVDEATPQFKDLGQMYRFNIDVKDTSRPWDSGDDWLEVPTYGTKGAPVITELKEEPTRRALIVYPKNRPAGTSSARWREDNRAASSATSDGYDEPYADGYAHGGTEHEQHCSSIHRVIDDIDTAANNACLAGNMSPHEYQEILDDLERVRLDLEGTLRLISG